MHATAPRSEHKVGRALAMLPHLDYPRRGVPAPEKRGSMSSTRRIAFLVWRDTSHPEGGGSELFVERVAEWLARPRQDLTIEFTRHENAQAEKTGKYVPIRPLG